MAININSCKAKQKTQVSIECQAHIKATFLYVYISSSTTDLHGLYQGARTMVVFFLVLVKYHMHKNFILRFLPPHFLCKWINETIVVVAL